MSLTPSKRIALIKEISARLGSESWQLINVTLGQFSLPRSDTFEGTSVAYVLAMIETANDQVLIELAQHVGFQFDSASSPRVDPPFWRKGMLRLFVSHLAAKRSEAGALQEGLLRYGISAFVAHSDIEPTLEWQIQIETALTSCEALVALLHEQFHASYWTDQEIGFALGRGVPAFSVRFGEDPYGFIGRFQAFNGAGKPAAILAREMFDAFRTNQQTKHRMGEILVGLFEESESFEIAKERIGFLEELDRWEPSFSSRVRSAAIANFQISSAWGVAERVTDLLKRWKSSAK